MYICYKKPKHFSIYFEGSYISEKNCVAHTHVCMCIKHYTLRWVKSTDLAGQVFLPVSPFIT